MKKKSLILMLTLFVLGAASAKAQVNIGSDAAPKPGAVLDLSQVSSHDLGLKLPVVSSLPTPSSDAKGLLVYSTTGAKGAGLYAWSGTAWLAYQPAAAVGVSLPTGVVATTGFTLINNSGNLLSVSGFIPSNASYPGVTWMVVSGTIEFVARTATTCMAVGNGVVRATSIDGNYYEETSIVTIVPPQDN